MIQLNIKNISYSLKKSADLHSRYILFVFFSLERTDGTKKDGGPGSGGESQKAKKEDVDQDGKSDDMSPEGRAGIF